MGQKISSNFTRLDLSTSYLSKWYSNKFNYANISFEDNLARYYITKFFGKILSLSNIYIKRINAQELAQIEECQIIINAKFPSLLKNKKILKILNKTFKKNYFLNKKQKNIFVKKFFILVIKKYSNFLAKLLSLTNNKKYKIIFNFIKNKFLDTQLIANYIAKELKNRRSYVFILKSVAKYLKKIKTRGAILQVSGRLNGAERAKTQTLRFGSVPAQTFSKDINFAKRKVKTNNGIIGIKVQIYLRNYATPTKKP